MLVLNNKGFTLTEVMISIVIGLVLVSSVAATYVTQNRSNDVQQSVSEVNNQSKVAHDIIANDIKSAGFGIPEDMNVVPINGYTNKLTPVDSTTLPDALTIVGGFRRIGTVWPTGVVPGSPCPASLAMGSASMDIIFLGLDSTAIPDTINKNFLTIDGIQFLTVQTITGKSITFDPPLPRAIPLVDIDGNGTCDTGRSIYLVENVTYCVDSESILHRIRRKDTTLSCYASSNSDDQIIAQNIEDLQFAYAVDLNSDGLPDDTDGDGEVNYFDGNAVANFDTIKAVRINILARGDREDAAFHLKGTLPAAIENHTHTQTPDDFRRRWWRSVKKVRND